MQHASVKPVPSRNGTVPRYFDSTDTEGYQKAKESWTYSGRGLVASHTEATSSATAATESFPYELRNRQLSRSEMVEQLSSIVQHAI
ncbi:MAG: hypothetical protein MUC83_11915 [Pirellula sp.]|jgi:hypothetical protein|nr:hypothetical protein [Pirellula sp.]